MRSATPRGLLRAQEGHRRSDAGRLCTGFDVDVIPIIDPEIARKASIKVLGIAARSLERDLAEAECKLRYLVERLCGRWASSPGSPARWRAASTPARRRCARTPRT